VDGKDTHNAIALAKLAMSCGLGRWGQQGACSAPCCDRRGGDEGENNKLIVRMLLIYSCNALDLPHAEPGQSQVQPECSCCHWECWRCKDNNMSVLKAVCNIVPKEEITIRYLGKYHNNMEETEQEIDRQYLQMATSVCISQHCRATHFLNLSLIEDSLASFHSTLLELGEQYLAYGNRDVVMLEELYMEIAEVTDGIKRAFKLDHH
jgi:hypothetical protein